MAWYYVDQTEQIGPIEDDTFEKLVQTGKITPDTLVWRNGLPEWLPYGQIPTPPPLTSAAENLKTSLSGKSEVSPSSEKLVYAGFWIRVAAKIIDFIILGAISSAIRKTLPSALFGDIVAQANTHPITLGDPLAQLRILASMLGISGLIDFALSLSYETFFLGKYGATVGKMACGLKVVRPDGSPVSYGQAAFRYFGEMLSALAFWIGYLMVAFDPQKRALHDRLCETRVIKK